MLLQVGALKVKPLEKERKGEKMATVIRVKNDRFLCEGRSSVDSLELVKKFLPYLLCDEIDKLQQTLFTSGERIEEIRLRVGTSVYATIGGGGKKRNVSLDYALDTDGISRILEKMCDGSLYAYSESITKGYVSLKNGIRVGVCGTADVENGKIRGIYNITSLNVRLPCAEARVSEGVLKAVRRAVTCGEGVLVYSPPSQGKTTLLRALAYTLSSGVSPLRVAVIDSREELGGALSSGELSLDILSGYPKAEGIRIATAFMNPQVIICDEIGSEDEAIAIAQAQNCGVPLIASAHGSCVESIMKRSGMRFLHDVGAFSLYVGIRIGTGMGFEYRIQNAKEAHLENIGDTDAAI